ncbi:hypothetical protein [Francisella tularensis]|uniref:hypothetical protein n=1 Tax=Francisella tularensis TaxID=263 RepID=UPI001F3BC662|nr:hypothetical protein [Francisella tularensis]
MAVSLKDIQDHLNDMLLCDRNISLSEKTKLIDNIKNISQKIKENNPTIVTKTEYDNDIKEIFDLVQDTRNKLDNIINKYKINHYSVYDDIDKGDDLEPNYSTPCIHISQLKEIEKTLTYNFKRFKKISHPNILTNRDDSARKKKAYLKAQYTLLKQQNRSNLYHHQHIIKIPIKNMTFTNYIDLYVIMLEYTYQHQQ